MRYCDLTHCDLTLLLSLTLVNYNCVFGRTLVAVVVADEMMAIDGERRG